MVESVQYLTNKSQYKRLESSVRDQIEQTQANIYLLKHHPNSDILQFTQTEVDQKTRILLKKLILKLDNSVVQIYLQELKPQLNNPVFYYLSKEQKMAFSDVVI